MRYTDKPSEIKTPAQALSERLSIYEYIEKSTWNE